MSKISYCSLEEAWGESFKKDDMKDVQTSMNAQNKLERDDVIKNMNLSNKIEDNIFWYKAKPNNVPPNWKFGHSTMWDFNKERYDISTENQF